MKCTHDSIEFDSLSEAMVYCWLREAPVTFVHQSQFPLTEKVTHLVAKEGKKKPVERTLLQASHYTADFIIYSEEAINGLVAADAGIFLPSFMSTYCYVIDVKGFRAPVSQVAKFSLTQKFMYHIHRIYVNKVVPELFFSTNGWPKRLPKECYMVDGKTLKQPWRRAYEANQTRTD